MNKAIVLSSGGVDSTTCVGLAVKELGANNVITVSVLYGQRHSREIECADKVAKYYGLRHEVLDLSPIYKYSNCSLLAQSTQEVPEGDYASQINKSDTGVVATYVPNRNALMLNAVAALGLSIFPNDNVQIWLGAHSDDAAGNAYPDCSQKFTDMMGAAISEGTDGQVSLVAPLVNMNKAQVVASGLAIEVPYQLTTSCYNGGECACANCGTCIDRILAFKTNRVIDPITYGVHVDWSGCNKIGYLLDAYKEAEANA